MASFPQVNAASAATISSSSPSSCPFYTLKSSISISGRSHRVVRRISCAAGSDDSRKKAEAAKALSSGGTRPGLERRDVLVGLGGLYGAASLGLEHGGGALAAPIAGPDISKCGPAELPPDATPTNCCPPFSSQVVDFTLPDSSAPLRTRPAAHLADADYVAKFAKALQLMKDLPEDDPRSFSQQAKVHCAYCDGSYTQLGFPETELQVHNSWLFLPFHRCYLYFFERIMGKLIGDDSFAMPFWNWDTPAGMTMPAMYTDPSTPMYDALRDALHQPPTLVDLDYNGEDPSDTNDQQTRQNLKVMYRQMVSNGTTATLFMGNPYRAGDDPAPGAGSLENLPHGPVHVWTGDRNQTNMEDMGNFYSAGRDPIFYAHHSNIDRLWNVWKGLGGRRRDFTDRDWLDAAFLLYDENSNLVRIRVRDCLDTQKLRYTYQDVNNPWLKARPAPALRTLQPVSLKKAAASPGGGATFPLTLKDAVTATVKRPKSSRSRKEKEKQEEVLVIDGIEVSRDLYAKFDVFINADGHHEGLGPAAAELAGSFVNVPHKHKHSSKEKPLKTRLQLGVTELLEVLDADGDGTVSVTIVPRKGKGKVKIGNVRIVLAD
ncbi:hypothetical protein Taro_048890 [Colocasia esculenta]|uniref:Tyrosinase copper-binding domain-containing protein n=1 Tax=Colocasia esculenta TaxID=4460 RepID=A0A843X9J2_COLES|nr:hypothetical protein [Colocasia esculenta]